MKQNTKGELIFSESDLCNLIMQGHDVAAMHKVFVDDSVDIEDRKSVV